MRDDDGIFVSFEFKWIRSGPRGNRRFDPPSSSQPRMRYPFSRQSSCGFTVSAFQPIEIQLGAWCSASSDGNQSMRLPIASS